MSDTCGSATTAVVDRSAEAAHYRGQLDHVVVIGVTGSCGKTTTKDLIAAILGVRFAGSKNDDTTELRARYRHNSARRQT